jgi:hypothetical protein
MKQLVSKIDETDYCKGIMPILKEGAPALYDRLDKAARSEIFDFYVRDGIRQGYIEFEDDELRSNFKKDFGIGDDEEIAEDDYYSWYDEEMDRIRCSGLKWIRSRYSVDDQVSMEEDPDYTVDIPVDFLQRIRRRIGKPFKYAGRSDNDKDHGRNDRYQGAVLLQCKHQDICSRKKYHRKNS